MKLRIQVINNIKALSTLPEGFTAVQAAEELNWPLIKARKVIERMNNQDLFHVEAMYVYIEGERAASQRAKASSTRRRTKVNHYRLTEYALSQVPPEPPKRFIPNSVFQLGMCL